jgi:hypothetical protein
MKNMEGLSINFREGLIDFFPIIQFCSCVLACVVYMYYGEYRKATYWFFASGITGTVTWLLK